MSKDLAVINDQDIQPVALNDIKKRYNITLKFFKDVMEMGTDYGTIPGTKGHSLYQPGAEKLARLYRLSIEKECVKEVTEFEKKFFYYRYRVTVKNAAGVIISQAERSCNSRERRFNRQDPVQELNTIEAMAQKRAFVAAVREAAMATTIFTDKEIEVDDNYNPKHEARRRLAARFFIAAQERGFQPERVKDKVKAKHKADSFNDLNEKQIEDAIATLESTYEKVGKNNPPRKIGIKSEDPVEEGEIVKDEEEKTPEKQTCYIKECNKEVMPESSFCSEAHKTEWQKSSGIVRKAKDLSFNDKLNKWKGKK